MTPPVTLPDTPWDQLTEAEREVIRQRCYAEQRRQRELVESALDKLTDEEREALMSWWCVE